MYTLTMTITIIDIMRKKLETIQGTASVQQAAKKMTDRNVSSLLIVDEKGTPSGIISERDLVTKVCYNDRNASAVTNQEIMSSPLITISPKSSPSEAADMMLQHNVRHLLVVDRGDSSNSNKPVGIITPLDFTRYQEYANDKEKDTIEKILEYYV
ncbi:MAG: CBS domain-containing protein [Thermoproteota archaeon]|nr:CBS domain-containing protein [Thermoproteota archaeon]